MALKQHLGFHTDIAWSSDDRNDNSVERINDTVSKLTDCHRPEFRITPELYKVRYESYSSTKVGLRRADLSSSRSPCLRLSMNVSMLRLLSDEVLVLTRVLSHAIIVGLSF